MTLIGLIIAIAVIGILVRLFDVPAKFANIIYILLVAIALIAVLQLFDVNPFPAIITR